MYLLHPLILGILLQYPPQPLRISEWWFAGATIATVGISALYYLLIEAPVIRWLRLKFVGDRPSQEFESLLASLRAVSGSMWVSRR